MVLYVVNPVSGHVCPVYFKIVISEPPGSCYTDLQVTRPRDIYFTYERAEDSLLIPLPESEFVPTSCGYDKEYVITDPYTSNDPTYAAIIDDNIEVYTTSFSYCGKRTIKLVVGILDHDAVPATFYYYVTVTCCGEAYVRVNMDVDDFVYLIGEFGPVHIDSEWSTGYPSGCDLEFSYSATGGNPSQYDEIFNLD